MLVKIDIAEIHVRYDYASITKAANEDAGNSTYRTVFHLDHDHVLSPLKHVHDDNIPPT